MSRLLTNRQESAADCRIAGKTRREAAAALGISPAAVKQRLLRARKRVLAKVPQNERDAARQETLKRYAAALRSGGKPVRFKPFSLLPGEA